MICIAEQINWLVSMWWQLWCLVSCYHWKYFSLFTKFRSSSPHTRHHQRKIWEYGSLRFRETYSEPVNYFCNSLHLRCLAEFWICFWFLLHISKSSLLVNVQASSNNFFSEQFFKNTYSIGIYSQLLLTSLSAGQALKLTFDF